MRLFYDQDETSVRNLETLGVETSTYGSLLIPLLTEKLPDDLRLRIARKFNIDVWELSQISQDHNIAALLVRGGTEHKRACVFCNKENHVSHKCLKVSDPKARFSILRRKKLSFICFKGGDLCVNCSKFKDYKCRKCFSKLNMSVCSRQAIPVARLGIMIQSQELLMLFP